MNVIVIAGNKNEINKLCSKIFYPIERGEIKRLSHIHYSSSLDYIQLLCAKNNFEGYCTSGTSPKKSGSNGSLFNIESIALRFLCLFRKEMREYTHCFERIKKEVTFFVMSGTFRQQLRLFIIRQIKQMSFPLIIAYKKYLTATFHYKNSFMLRKCAI